MDARVRHRRGRRVGREDPLLGVCQRLDAQDDREGPPPRRSGAGPHRGRDRGAQDHKGFPRPQAPGRARLGMAPTEKKGGAREEPRPGPGGGSRARRHPRERRAAGRHAGLPRRAPGVGPCVRGAHQGQERRRLRTSPERSTRALVKAHWL